MASIELDSFYLEVAEELPARSRDKLIAAIVRKIAFGEEPVSLPATLKAVYKALKPTIERSITNSKNGKKGGRPKTEIETETAKNSEKPETETETKNIKKAQKHETEIETQTVKNAVNTETEIETQEEKNTIYIDSKDLRNTKNTELYSDSKDTEKQEIESNNNIKSTIDTVNTRNREFIVNNNIKSYITPYSPLLSEENKTETEKKREKPKTETKTQITEIADRVVDYLNLKAGTSYRHGIAKTISLVSARLKDGFTENDFALVINKKCEEWNNTDYAKYLRPETLFGTKFESYLNQISQQNRIDSRSITSPQKNTVPREKRLPWVPDAVYDLPDFGYITSDVYPYDGIIEYIDCNNNYASWEAPNKETAQKIDADYKAYAAEKERQRKESKDQ